MNRNNFVVVSPGRFIMGSPANEQDRERGEVLTKVGLTTGFSISKYLVTQAEYQAIAGRNPSKHLGPQNPVDSVIWDDAVEFCRVATVDARLSGTIGSGESYRLPTEAEWEYCCRAGTDTRFSFGDDPGYTELPKYGWVGGWHWAKPETEHTHPVGQLLPNDWGLFDMHGNVLEWCSDFMGPLKGGEEIVTNPKGPASDVGQVMRGHVVRGGSWFGMPRFSRSAWRGASLYPDHKCGFRVVLGVG